MVACRWGISMRRVVRQGSSTNDPEETKVVRQSIAKTKTRCSRASWRRALKQPPPLTPTTPPIPPTGKYEDMHVSGGMHLSGGEGGGARYVNPNMR